MQFFERNKLLLTLILSQDFFLDPDGPSIPTLELTESPGIRFRYYLGILQYKVVQSGAAAAAVPQLAATLPRHWFYTERNSVEKYSILSTFVPAAYCVSSVCQTFSRNFSRQIIKCSSIFSHLTIFQWISYEEIN